jgi:hypothetical protein
MPEWLFIKKWALSFDIQLHGYGAVGPFSSISATFIIRMTNRKNNWIIL